VGANKYSNKYSCIWFLSIQIKTKIIKKNVAQSPGKNSAHPNELKDSNQKNEISKNTHETCITPAKSQHISGIRNSIQKTWILMN